MSCHANLRSLCLMGTLFAGVVLSVLLLPQSFGSDKDNEDHSRFFDPLPPGVLADYGNTPVAAGGALQSHDITTRPPPQKLFPIITGADLNDAPIIEFRVVDEYGIGIDGLEQGETVAFSFTVSKLIPGSNGKTRNWGTYIRGADEGVEGVQGTTYSDGTLDDAGDGTYTFTFDQDLESISDVVFEPTLTHRVGMEIRNAVVFGASVAGSDTTFDVQPSTGETTGIVQRHIITQEACASCHGTEEFAFHGGPRQHVSYCVTCHQPDSLDGGTGNTLDFSVMVHKIHFGENLTELYEICGYSCERFGAPPQNFSHVAFPQDVRNCTTCHDPDNPETPQADWVDNRATAEVCASCHDDLAFDETGLTNANRNHIGLAQPNETCVACHSESGFLQGNLAYHAIDSQVAARRFQYNILDIANTGEGQSPVVTFSITDPTNDDRPYDLASDPEFTGSGTSINMDIAWPNSDYTNVADSAGTSVIGRPVSTPASIPLSNGSGILPAGVTDNGDGTYTVDTFATTTPLIIPMTIEGLGSGTVVMEGHPAADFDYDGSYDDQVPVTAVTAAFAINDAEAQPRRMVVEMAKCQNCHGENDGLAFHGNNRTDNPQACAACHNPNATDLFRRPVDPDGVLNGENLEAADFLEDRTIDFKYMIHAIHGSSKRQIPYVAYGFGTRPHDFSEVGYPRSPSDCLACHTDGTYNLPLGDNVLATTLSSNATVIAGSRFGASGYAPDDFAASDPTDDNNASATAAVCSSCHDSEIAMNHMSVRSDSPISFGNAFLMNPDPFSDPDTQARIDMAGPENCSFCHGVEGFVPVAEAHGLDD